MLAFLYILIYDVFNMKRCYCFKVIFYYLFGEASTVEVMKFLAHIGVLNFCCGWLIVVVFCFCFFNLKSHTSSFHIKNVFNRLGCCSHLIFLRVSSHAWLIWSLWRLDISYGLSSVQRLLQLSSKYFIFASSFHVFLLFCFFFSICFDACLFR